MSIAGATNVHETSRGGAVADVAAPGANAAATVTYAAGGAGVSHCIGGVCASLSPAPAASVNLSITDGGALIFSLDLAPTQLVTIVPFEVPKRGTANAAMVITLAAGGVGVSGKVSVLSHWTETDA